MRRLVVGRRGAIAWLRDGNAVLGHLAAFHRAILVGMTTLFQQRVLLQLLIDEFPDLEIGQLQQLDRLLKLRRHDERLRLPQVQSLDETHRPPSAWNIGGYGRPMEFAGRNE